ncbi:MAG: RNA polymerase sigma factor [Deltaproteobacteria bacterium]|nr:RNA polymerase sigma factor [Deltaproteobacteria bacterium]
MAQFVDGDTAAFDTLLARYNRPVFNFIYRFVRNTERAEDILQDVFMRVVRGAKDYRRESKFSTWLYAIARNLCIDDRRREVFRRGPSLDQTIGGDDDDGPALIDTVSDSAAGSDEKAFGREIQPRIAAALALLNPDQREVFLLREVSGLAFQEIAEIVGVSENTVKSRMRYAIEHLRKTLEGVGIDRAAALEG